MGADYRRTIDELLARYDLEPNLRDIYVEGDVDLSFCEWFFSNNLEDVSIYKIETVSVECEECGNKDRLVLLAKIIQDNLGGDLNNFLCIADKDFDLLNENMKDYIYLKYTDFSCLEMYIYEFDVINKIFLLFFRRELTKELFDNLSEVLRTVYYIRYEKSLSYDDASWVGFTRCCSFKDEVITFDKLGFVSRLISKHRNSDEVSAFVESVDANLALSIGEIKEQIHGHDFIELLSWFCRKLVKKVHVCHEETISRTVWVSADKNIIAANGLFNDLSRWVSKK